MSGDPTAPTREPANDDDDEEMAFRSENATTPPAQTNGTTVTPKVGQPTQNGNDEDEDDDDYNNDPIPLDHEV